MLNDEELERYSRHILLPEMDLSGQEALKKAHVAIVGVGGLGSPVAMYLAAAGIGQLNLIDHDEVDLSNLQRQIVHTSNSIGEAKVESARHQLFKLNPHVNVRATHSRLSADNIQQALATPQVILDCSDNFSVRFLLNRYSVAHQIPLVSGAAVRFDGQVSVFDPLDPNSPCYHCLYDEAGEDDQRCVNNGVLAPVVGMVGSIQAVEAIKMLTGIGESLIGRLLLVDAYGMRFRSIKLSKNPQCPVCSGQFNNNGYRSNP